MNIDAFKTFIIEGLKQEAETRGLNIQVDEISSLKNGIVRDGIVPKIRQHEEQGPSTAPVFYTQILYDMFMNGSDAVELIQNMIEVAMSNPGVDDIEDRVIAAMKELVIPVLLSREGKEDLLEELVHRDFMDLAVVYKVQIFEEDGSSIITTISKGLAKIANMTEDDLFEIATRNLKDTMIILENLNSITNKAVRYGSNLMLINDGFDYYCDQYDESIYVIPSSVDELFILPESEVDNVGVEFWKKILEKGNKCFCTPERVLSYSIYFYDRKTKTLKIAE